MGTIVDLGPIGGGGDTDVKWSDVQDKPFDNLDAEFQTSLANDGSVVLQIAYPSNSGLTVTGSGLSVKCLSTGGLQTASTGLSVKCLSTGGLQTASTGLSVKCLSTGGLQTASTGLSIKLASGSGLKLSSSGLAVDKSSLGGWKNAYGTAPTSMQSGVLIFSCDQYMAPDYYNMIQAIANPSNGMDLMAVATDTNAGATYTLRLWRTNGTNTWELKTPNGEEAIITTCNDSGTPVEASQATQMIFAPSGLGTVSMQSPTVKFFYQTF